MGMDGSLIGCDGVVCFFDYRGIVFGFFDV